MPEGDTIFRAARTLHRALSGRTIARFEAVLPSLTRIHDDTPVTGRTIDRVESVGKHLLMHFSGGLVLRTHMRMNGSWHIYRPGERWRRPRRDMRVLIATDAFEAVGFNLPVAEFVRASDLPRHTELGRLGPDLLADEFDRAEAIGRLRHTRSMPVAEALLDQRVVAGIGNVYKSEVLFSCGVNPFVDTSALTDAQLECLVDTARRYLLANVVPGRSPMTAPTGYRRTTGRDGPKERLWVYGRGRQPCRRCRTPIAVRKEGPHARLTYWCPVCQRHGHARMRS